MQIDLLQASLYSGNFLIFFYFAATTAATTAAFSSSFYFPIDAESVGQKAQRASALLGGLLFWEYTKHVPVCWGGLPLVLVKGRGSIPRRGISPIPSQINDEGEKATRQQELWK